MNVLLHLAGLRSGGGRADALNLLTALPTRYPEHRFLAAVPAGVGYEALATPPNCELRYVPLPPLNELWRLYFDNIRVPALARAFHADVVFSMGNTGPLRLRGCRHVLMLRQAYLAYPVSALRRRGLPPSLRFRLMRWHFRHVLRGVDLLVTQTRTMANLVREEYGFRGPVRILPKTVSGAIRTDGASATERGRRQAERVAAASGFRLLYVSRYYAHKGMELACRGVAEARRRGLDVTLFLTIDREDGPGAARLLDGIVAGSVPGVVSLGRVDLADLESVYRAADGVLNTSRLESFSATYIEGMAYRRPMIVHDYPFAREICGPAALYCAPDDEEAVAAAITRVAAEPALRERLVSAGERRFQEYDVGWERVAERYMALLSDAEASRTSAS